MLLRRNISALTVRTQHLLILAGAFLLIFLRAPSLLIHGRVYAEEGTTYLHYAWDVSIPQALLSPHQGYYSLLPNLCALIAARLLPLAAAGLFLSWCALLIQLLTVWLATLCEQFPTIQAKTMAALIVVLAVPSNDVWLNTINSQFYLAACVAIIFVSDASRHRIVRHSVLLLAGLTGVVSCFLLPFFLFRAIRNRAARLQAGILSACTGVHATVLFHIGFRHFQHHFSYLPEVFLVKSVLLPFFSRVPAVLAGRFALHHIVAPLLLASLAVSLVFLFLIFKFGRSGGPAAVCLCLMGIWIQLLSWYGAIDDGSHLLTTGDGGRYAFTCNLLIGLAVVLLHLRAVRRSRLRTVSKVLFIALLVSGLLDYGLFWRRLAAGPQWSKEVAHRQVDPEYALHIAPVGWPPLFLSQYHANRKLPADIYDSIKDNRVMIVIR